MLYDFCHNKKEPEKHIFKQINHQNIKLSKKNTFQNNNIYINSIYIKLKTHKMFLCTMYEI